MFSESQGRAVVAVDPANVDQVMAAADEAGVACADIGEVGGDRLVVQTSGDKMDALVEDLLFEWRTALPRALDL